jgi:hypothetical protein
VSKGALCLQCGDRMHGVGAADCGRTCLGQSDVADLALGDQFGEGPTVSSMGGLRIEAVLVVQVDVVGFQPLQAAFKISV